MGKTTILTPKQLAFIDALCADKFITKTFYFTGGTALAEVYLKHRKSEDLDFFSANTFDPQRILATLNPWSRKLGVSIRTNFIDPTHMYFLQYPDGSTLKVDFASYPYPSLAKQSLYNKTLRVDSLLDIAVNKLVTLTQRSDVKDFVDLYYLLRKFTFWELRDGAVFKFNIKFEPYSVASSFMAVEDFDYLPRMVKPLALAQLKAFFQKQAKKLGKTAIE